MERLRRVASILCIFAMLQLVNSYVADEAGVVYKSTIENDASNADFRIGVMLSNTTDDGYSYVHAIALGQLVRSLQERNISVVHEMYIQGSDEQTLNAMRSWRNRQFDVIFSTSGSLTDIVQQYMLEDNITHIATWGSVVPDHRAEWFDNRAWQATYLAGVMCGMASKTNNIAWIGISITRSTIRNLNAFYLGARSIRRNIRVHSTFTNVLFDPLLESRAAQLMIDNENIDCALGTVDSLRTFQENKLPSIGFNSDVRYDVGQSVWASVFNDWTSTYDYVATQILNGTYGSAKRNLCAMGECCDIGPFSPVVPLNVQERIISTRAQILEGTLRLFCGDDAATLGFNVTSPTTCLTDSQIRSQASFHPSIINNRNISYSDIYENIFVHSDEPVAITLHVFTGVFLLIAIVFLVLLAKYWNTKIIRYGSPVFLLTMCIADALGLMSVYAWTGEPTYISCQMRVWLLGLAVSASIGALIVKNLRIWLIFRNVSYGVFAVETYKLFIGMAGIVLWNVVILIIWTATDPFMPVYATSVLIEEWQFYKRCGSQSLGGPLTFVISQALFVVVLCFIASRTSKVGRELESRQKTSANIGSFNNNDELLAYYFDESNQIYSIAFTILLLGFLLIGVIVGTPYTPHTEVFAYSIYFLVAFTGLLMFILGIKFYRIIFAGKTDLSSSAHTTSNPSNKNSIGTKSADT